MLFRRTDRTLTVDSPAKLNLFLEVLGRRPDNYHEIETLMVAVDWFDSLGIQLDASPLAEPAPHGVPGVRLVVHQAFDRGVVFHRSHSIPVDSRNLVVRAAELIAPLAAQRQPVRIDLVKRIPPESGLAGGSANAAAALVALNEFWQVGLSQIELAELASQLGSDIPFFLSSHNAAVCTGRGERIDPLRLAGQLHVVIVRPKTGVSTAEVYRRCRSTAQPQSVEKLRARLLSGEVTRGPLELWNALQEPAEQINPEIHALCGLLQSESPLGVLMSGSGSACFAVCHSIENARRIASRLRARQIGSVRVANTLAG